MKKSIFIFLIFIFSICSYGQIKKIHVYVSLCDNKYQGIVPVPEKIGNGQDYTHNLYWGAGYGVKSFLKLKTNDWNLVSQLESSNPVILDRLLFKHAIEEIYLLADAYDGKYIKTCIEDFLIASNSQNPIEIKFESEELSFRGNSDLLAYVGHNGLMDFNIDIKFKEKREANSDVIILACYSRAYFTPYIIKANANPVLWTTHLMAPEAYTLKSAIDGWINNETGTQIEERAAQTYNQYQKCGLKGARNLFTSGFTKLSQ